MQVGSVSGVYDSIATPARIQGEGFVQNTQGFAQRRWYSEQDSQRRRPADTHTLGASLGTTFKRSLQNLWQRVNYISLVRSAIFDRLFDRLFDS